MKKIILFLSLIAGIKSLANEDQDFRVKHLLKDINTEIEKYQNWLRNPFIVNKQDAEGNLPQYIAWADYAISVNKTHVKKMREFLETSHIASGCTISPEAHPLCEGISKKLIELRELENKLLNMFNTAKAELKQLNPAQKSLEEEYAKIKQPQTYEERQAMLQRMADQMDQHSKKFESGQS